MKVHMICDLSYYDDLIADKKAFRDLEKAKEERRKEFGKLYDEDDLNQMHPIIEVEIV